MDSRKKKKKKRSSRKLVAWVIGDLTIAIILILLLMHTPAGYKPANVDVSKNAPEQVHRYLTHLGSELYNGAQTHEAFELVVLEAGINQAKAKVPQVEAKGDQASAKDVPLRLHSFENSSASG